MPLRTSDLRTAFHLIAGALGGTWLGTPVPVPAAAPEECVPGVLRLKLRSPVLDDGDARARVSAFALEAGRSPAVAEMSFPTAAPGFAHYERKHAVGLDRWVRLTVPASVNLAEEIRRWNGHPEVEVAECIPRVYPAAAPTDPLWSRQWQHDNTGSNPTVPAGTPDADLDTDEAWDIQTGNVRVANLESTDWYHPDLFDNVWQNLGEDFDGDGSTVEWDSTLARWVLDAGDQNLSDDDLNGYRDDLVGWNFKVGGNLPEEGPSDHGTGTAGFLLAVPNNGTGISGTCWGCELISVYGAQKIEKAMTYAADNGAKVINMSLVALVYTQAFEDALEYVHGLGTVVVVAAGNGDSQIVNSYCENQKALCVGATDNQDRIVTGLTTGGVWGTSYGAALDVSTPGIHLTHLLADSGYAPGGSGTSWSAPLASGVAALLLSENPALSPDEVISILQSTTDPFTAPDRFAGMGRVNAKSAVDAAVAAAALGSYPVGVIQSLLTSFTATAQIEIWGTADSPSFASYRVRVGEGLEPASWLVDQLHLTPVQDSLLHVYDASSFNDSTVFTVELEVTDTNGQTAVDRHTPLLKPPSANDLPGWPISTTNLFAAPAMGELNGAPGLEILVARGDTLFAFQADGTVVPGWPVLDVLFPSSPPTVCDLDGDGRDEVVLVYWETPTGPWWLTVLEEDGTTAPGWPQALPARPTWYPAVGDLDGDGEVEIVQFSGIFPPYQVGARHIDGTTAAGWPRVVSSQFVAGPVFGDVDGDGDSELAVSTSTEFHVLDETGTNLPGWPWVELSIGSPVAADFDRDGKEEIVRATTGTVSVHGEDGTPLPGWPVLLTADVERLVVADADRDGTPEIFVKAVGRDLYAIESDGTVWSGWPYDTGLGTRIFHAVADVEGDPELEVIYSASQRIWALELDATAGSLWPINVAPLSTVSNVVLGDVTGDGVLEMVVVEDLGPPSTGQATMHVYDRGGFASAGDWPRLHRDGANSRRQPSAGAVSAGPSGSGPTSFRFERPRPNPAGGEVRFRWALPAPARTRLRVFDVSGRLVATLVSSSLPAGTHSALWNGRGADGRPAAAGVYFARLDAPPHTAVQKLIGGLR